MIPDLVHPFPDENTVCVTISGL